MGELRCTRTVNSNKDKETKTSTCRMCSREIYTDLDSRRQTLCGSSTGYILCCVILCVILHAANAQNLRIDAWEIGNSLQDNGEGSGRTSPVSLMWGIADTSATVGKMFNYAIPSDAFKGTVLKYKVSEAGKDTLPGWLVFDDKTKSLKGIATPDDMKHHYIEVVAQGQGRSKAKDVFSITVSAETPSHHVPSVVSNSNGKPQTVKCKTEQPETTVTIVLDTDMKEMLVDDRLRTIQKFQDYFNLASDMLKLLPLGTRPMFDSSAMVAGPGDKKKPETPGMTMSWLVGCGKVEGDHMKILHKIQATSEDGTLRDNIGHPVIGWHVTYTANHLKPRRKRAAIRATATPVQTPSPPTDLPDTIVTDTEIKPTASSEQMSRSVPSMESPAFTSTQMIKPTKAVTMPSASPTPPEPTTPMMTKLPTETPKPTMKPKVTTEAILPSEKTEEPKADQTTTQILPTRTYVVTDAPTSVVPTTPKKEVTEKPETENPEPTTKKPVTETPSINCPDDNQPRRPVVKGTTEVMLFPVGRETMYSVPNDLFMDCFTPEGTIGLRLNVLNGTETLPRNFWLSVSRRTDEWKLIGFPLPRDLGSTSLTLAAENKFEIGPAFHTIKVGVVPNQAISGEPTHKVSLTFEGNYKKFGPKKMKDLTRKVAGVFSNKKDANDQITVLDVSAGSIVYSWTNNTLPTNKCPVRDVREMMKKLVNDDGTLKKSAKRKLEPFVLNEVESNPLGACEQDPNFPRVDTRYLPTPKPKDLDTTAKAKPTMEPRTPTPTMKVTEAPTTKEDSELKGKAAQGTSDDEIWITTVVPAVVVVGILLIALIIACVLYRKQRKGKMSLEDQHTFVNKGVPVILPDEYDEKPNDSTKPLIMEDEKPPMPPPEYTRASSESSRSSDHRHEDQEEHEMDETDVTSPLYRPPPPVQSTGSNKQPRPHIQPAYKNPTPYVPP